MSDFKADLKAIGATVRQRAAGELRNRIVSGRLPPGSRLDLDQLTEEFGTSRTPIREALIELSHEGLVTVAPRSGITVLGLTAADAVDNFSILATLAGKAAEWAATRITDEELAGLRDLAEAATRADDVVAANWRFHRAVNLAARSPRLLVFIRHAVRIVPENYFELFPEQEQQSRRDHAALIDAIGRGNGRDARTVAEQHVLHAGDALGDWLHSRPPTY
jgi:DNA-binding GntR family transcriptional regulator